MAGHWLWRFGVSDYADRDRPAFTGFSMLVENDVLLLQDPALRITQVALTIFLGAVAGVLIRWIGMDKIKEDLKINALPGGSLWDLAAWNPSNWLGFH